MGECAEICRRHGPAGRAQCADRVLPSPRAALEAIARCRPEALGGHLSQGTAWGALADRSHAWKNRPGPQGHRDAATRWLDPPRALLLPGPSCLVTFPLPAALRPVARSPQRCLDPLLLPASAAAWQALALDPPALGGPSGMAGGLHTWTRDLASPPPGHALVPGGALAPEGSPWCSPRCAAWLVPVRARSRLCRGTCKAAWTTAGLCAPVPSQVWPNDGVTPGQPAGPGAAVLASCAPSLSRMALTTTRLDTLVDGHGTCRGKQRHGTVWKRLTRPAETFLHRFLPPGLPRRCSHARAYGLLRPSRRQGLPPIRTLLAARSRHALVTQSTPPQVRPSPRPVPAQGRRCRTWGGLLVVLGRLSPPPREPP